MAEKPEAVVEIAGLEDLTLDPRNANRGNERGLGMLDQSLRRYGAGRSILVDRRGVTIAGAKTLERAADIGLPVRVVKSDGRELVVVQRTDLDMESDGGKAHALAIADNRAGEVNLAWDVEALGRLQAEGLKLDEWWLPEELTALGVSVPEFDPAPAPQGRLDVKSPVKCPKCGNEFTP